MSFSDILENKVLDHIFHKGGNTYTPATNLYVSLHVSDPGEAYSSGELPVSNGYARQAITFAAANNGAKANYGDVTFGPASGSAWAAVTHFGIWSTSAGTVPVNFLGSGALSVSRTVADGDSAEFASGALSITLT